MDVAKKSGDGYTTAAVSPAFVGPPPAAPPQEPKAKVGDYVQWASQGMDQFQIPQQVVWVSEDGNWLRVRGSQTGVPMTEVQIMDQPQDSMSGGVLMEDLHKPGGRSTDRQSTLKVLIDGDHLQVSATIFDRKGIEKLIKTLNANKELLDEETSDKSPNEDS